MNLTEHLLSDHWRIRELLARLADRRGSARNETLARLGRELSIHASTEEDLLYPLLEQTDLGEDIRHAYEEHHLISVQFDEILKLREGDPVITDKIHVLDEVVKHHLDEEESDLFPQLRTSLGHERAAKVADAYPELRKELELEFDQQPPSSIQGWVQRRSLSPRR